MTYTLGIDLGTTFSAAAVHRDGRTYIVELGSRSASIPSVVLLKEDETILAGDAAQRRAASEPQRVAREFKRRIGDTTPMLLGGSPYSAEALSARLLGWIVQQVTEREGGPPAAIAVTHPANWGPYKTDLLQQAVRLAGLDHVELITEPEAAVRHYASHERVDPGTVIAVYDLGGGTFDAALLRKTEDGFEPLGRPEGIERLGGIDFDAAVLGHVVRALGGAVEALDQDDPTVLQALARLRQECVDAKEALSGDSDVSIPVLLPNIQTEVRLTRQEFESMIRPSLADSLAAMDRALASAGVTPDEVSAVLLVGGSSRIPLVAQLVSNEFGRPVALDADPKHAIALGAALVASARVEAGGADATVDVTTPAAAIDGAAVEPLVDDTAQPSAPDEPPPPVVGPEPEPEPELELDATVPRAAAGGDRPPPERPVAAAATSGDGGAARSSKVPYVVGAVVVLVLIVVGVVAFGGGGGGDDDAPAEAATVTTVPGSVAVATTPATAATTPVTQAATATTAATTPATTTTTIDPATLPTECPTGPERTACITDISIDDDGGIVAGFVTTGYVPELEPTDYHVHFYFDSVVGDDEGNAGVEGSGGDWRIWDAPNPFIASGGDGGRPGYTLAEAQAVNATKLCSIVATPQHAAVVGTGNCIAIPYPDGT